MANYEIVKCTRCGKEFEDLRIEVSLNIYTEQKLETGLFEEIPNLTQTTREVLCKDCFERLCSVFEQMNVPENDEVAKRMKEREENPLSGIKVNNNVSCDCNTENQHKQPSEYVKIEEEVKYDKEDN